jgi:hypothetical protein
MQRVMGWPSRVALVCMSPDGESTLFFTIRESLSESPHSPYTGAMYHDLLIVEVCVARYRTRNKYRKEAIAIVCMIAVLTTPAVQQMLELRLWPPLRDLSTDIIRSSCLSVFKPEELPSGHTLFAAGSPVPSDASSWRAYLLVQGTVLCGLPATGRSAGNESDCGKAISDFPVGLAITDVVRAPCPGMALMLGLEGLSNSHYSLTRVCK